MSGVAKMRRQTRAGVDRGEDRFAVGGGVPDGDLHAAPRQLLDDWNGAGEFRRECDHLHLASSAVLKSSKIVPVGIAATVFRMGAAGTVLRRKPRSFEMESEHRRRDLRKLREFRQSREGCFHSVERTGDKRRQKVGDAFRPEPSGDIDKLF